MPSLGKLLSRYIPYLTAVCYKSVLGLLLRTCRWRVHGLQHLPSDGRCILLLWHDHLMLAAPLLCRFAAKRRYVAVVSDSSDGKLLGRLVATYAQAKVLYVSQHIRFTALRAIMSILRRGEHIIVMTPDGPKGPSRCVKPGAAFAAKYTEATIVPLSWHASRVWQLATWDKMALPKPFATIEVCFGPQRTFTPEIPLEQITADLQSMLEV